MTGSTASLAASVVAVTVLLLTLSGCGSDSAEAAVPRIEVVDAFTAEGTMALAVYLDLENRGGADRIVGAETVGDSASMAAEVTLHQTAERDGLSIMEPTDAIDVAGGTEDALDPAGAHIMLGGVADEITAEQTVQLRLDLDRSEDITIEVRVVTTDVAVGLLTEEAS